MAVVTEIEAYLTVVNAGAVVLLLALLALKARSRYPLTSPQDRAFALMHLALLSIAVASMSRRVGHSSADAWIAVGWTVVVGATLVLVADEIGARRRRTDAPPSHLPNCTQIHTLTPGDLGVFHMLQRGSPVDDADLDMIIPDLAALADSSTEPDDAAAPEDLDETPEEV